MGFSYKKEVSQNCLIFSLEGRFLEREEDRGIVNEIDLIKETEQKGVILNMDALEYINSIGINALVKIVSKANLHQRNIVLVAVPKRILDLLEIIKLNAVFTIKNEITEGINFLNNQS